MVNGGKPNGPFSPAFVTMATVASLLIGAGVTYGLQLGSSSSLASVVAQHVTRGAHSDANARITAVEVAQKHHAANEQRQWSAISDLNKTLQAINERLGKIEGHLRYRGVPLVGGAPKITPRVR